MHTYSHTHTHVYAVSHPPARFRVQAVGWVRPPPLARFDDADTESVDLGHPPTPSTQGAHAPFLPSHEQALVSLLNHSTADVEELQPMAVIIEDD